MKKNILIITLVVSIGVVVAGVAMINSNSKDSSSAVVEPVDSNKTTTDDTNSTDTNNTSSKASENTDNSTNNTDNTENSTPATNNNPSGETVSNPGQSSEVKASNESVSVAIGEVNGSVGSEIIVPVTITDTPKSGIGSCDFKVNYDTTALELIEITPGDVLVNPEANFSSSSDQNLGIASFLYLDNTFEKEAITKNGVFANIKFKVKDGATGAKEVAFKSIGAFTDNALSSHEVKTTNGK
uniref:Hydrophobic protein A n=1 Tax=Clostridium cellulovorans TaxID=1493 RepID=Q9RGE7_CLOCL|nr:hydrophobic protein A [Clostridium cellulovorans 743B]